MTPSVLPDWPPVAKPGTLSDAVQHLRDAELEGRQQLDARKQMLKFCKAHEDALHRTCLEGHLTGSAVVVDPSRNKTLLLHHTKLGIWVQPGGHADGDGDLGRVALREAEEETGLSNLRLVTPAIDVDSHHIPERGSEPAHVHHDVRFLVLAEPGAIEDTNHESTDARWVGLEDPEGLLASVELNRLVRRALFVAAAYNALT